MESYDLALTHVSEGRFIENSSVWSTLQLCTPLDGALTRPWFCPRCCLVGVELCCQHFLLLWRCIHNWTTPLHLLLLLPCPPENPPDRGNKYSTLGFNKHPSPFPVAGSPRGNNYTSTCKWVKSSVTSLTSWLDTWLVQWSWRILALHILHDIINDFGLNKEEWTFCGTSLHCYFLSALSFQLIFDSRITLFLHCFPLSCPSPLCPTILL